MFPWDHVKVKVKVYDNQPTLFQDLKGRMPEAFEGTITSLQLSYGVVHSHLLASSLSRTQVNQPPKSYVKSIMQALTYWLEQLPVLTIKPSHHPSYEYQTLFIPMNIFWHLKRRFRSSDGMLWRYLNWSGKRTILRQLFETHTKVYRS